MYYLKRMLQDWFPDTVLCRNRRTCFWSTHRWWSWHASWFRNQLWYRRDWSSEDFIRATDSDVLVETDSDVDVDSNSEASFIKQIQRHLLKSMHLISDTLADAEADTLADPVTQLRYRCRLKLRRFHLSFRFWCAKELNQMLMLTLTQRLASEADWMHFLKQTPNSRPIQIRWLTHLSMLETETLIDQKSTQTLSRLKPRACLFEADSDVLC